MADPSPERGQRQKRAMQVGKSDSGRPVPPPPPPPKPPKAGPSRVAAVPLIDVGADGPDRLHGRSHGPRGGRAARKRMPWLVATALVGVAVAAGVAFVVSSAEPEPLRLRPIGEQQVDELALLEFDAAVDGPEQAAAGPLEFSLADAPEGAAIDPDTGRFSWTPREDQGPGFYELHIRVKAGKDGQTASRKVAILVQEVAQPPVLETIDDKTVTVGEALRFPIEASDPDLPSQEIRLRLDSGAPAGAKLDRRTGLFTWTPRREDAGQTREITVQALKGPTAAMRSDIVFRVQVEDQPAGDVATGPAGSPTPREWTTEQFIEQLRGVGLEVETFLGTAPQPEMAGRSSTWAADGEPFVVFEYANAAAANLDVSMLSAEDLKPLLAASDAEVARLFHSDKLVVFYVGQDPELLNRMDEHLGRPRLVARPDRSPPPEDPPAPVSRREPATPPVPENTPAAQSESDEFGKTILELYESGQLLSKKEYPRLRAIYASRFEKRHADTIRNAWGDEQSDVRRWLAERPDIREEFFLAINPEHDDVRGCLQRFQELYERFPDSLEKYANLAIAVSVVWDCERGVYDYRRHADRAKARMPENQVGALENFQYLVDAERFMQGRAQFLPWEFLVLLVDHRTPPAERQWALINYVSKRVDYGKCYHDVPYDHDMLAGRQPHLAAKDYTLPNVRAFGGVCAYQADFAARVGKSMGVPAFYANAEGKWGSRHAWVMWVELGSVTPTGFTFELKSHGRYRGDKYYVGNAIDPHTGQSITDRTLELRLHTVGMDPVAKRQANLAMQSYPLLCEKASMDTTDKLVFLNQVIQRSPGTESAWKGLAQLSRDGAITKTNGRPMMSSLDRLFTTFANVPDFTWEVFDDMIAFQDIPKQRAALYARLCRLYEQVQRPDLSCKARLKYVEYLEAEGEHAKALEVLAAAIMLFPDEGRYVPKMLDRLEELAQNVDGSQRHVVRLYQALLPQIPKKRGDAVSQYWVDMCRRGAARFREAGQPAMAQFYEAQLVGLRAGAGT